MDPIAQAHGTGVARVALAWRLARPTVTPVIIGAKTEAQLDDNLEAASMSRSADEIAALDAVSAPPAEYPGWMIARQSTDRRPG